MIVLLTTLAFASASVVKYEPKHQPWKEMTLTAEVAHSSGRFKRHIERNENGEITCNLPNGKPGICKPEGQCDSDEDNKTYINNFIDYLCMLDNTTPGICCPDKIKLQKHIQSEGTIVDRTTTIQKENNRKDTNVSCNLQDGTPGICKPEGQCDLYEDNKTIFGSYLDSLCMIDDTKPGSCCPNRDFKEKHNHSAGSTVDRPAPIQKENIISCNLQDGTPGICKPVGQCGLDKDNTTNFGNYYDSLCMLDDTTPGSCCPVSSFNYSGTSTVDRPATDTKENNVSCNLQDGTPGICKPVGECGLDKDNTTNFGNYYDSLCMLDDTTPGSCCPVSSFNYSETSTVDRPATDTKENNVSCNLQDGTAGICKPVGECGLDKDNTTNFGNYYDSLCMLDDTTPGSCCPVSSFNYSESSTVDRPATDTKENNVSCNLQDGTAGICKPVGQCGLDKDNITNFGNYYDSPCMLDDTTPGSCCPVKVEIQIRFTSTGLAVERPAATCSDEDNDCCDLPDGKPGICKPVLQCVSDDDIKNNLPQFLNSLCVLGNSKKIGACCPDSSKTFGVYSLAENLPATASKKENKDTLLKISKAENRGCGFSKRPRDELDSSGLINSHTWPWMASISIVGGMKHHCGGVLITDRHILTAAHCLNNVAPEDLRVRLGEYDFKVKDESRTYTFNVVEMIQHEEYDKLTKWNDIAILKLHQAAVFNTYVWPVCLPLPGLELVNETAILTGWGTIRFGAPISNVLKEVEMPIWDHEQCAQNFVDTVFAENYCVGGYTGGKDACQYDSGGPLMYKMPSGRWVSIGVVSWGLRCGEPNHPGIYTRTDKYLDWIAMHT